MNAAKLIPPIDKRDQRIEQTTVCVRGPAFYECYFYSLKNKKLFSLFYFSYIYRCVIKYNSNNSKGIH